MLREYAAAGVEPVHSQGFLFSLSLVDKIRRDQEQMAKALTHRREHEEPGR